jgi:hypothetical protein
MQFSDQTENIYKWVRKFVQTIKTELSKKNRDIIAKKSEDNFFNNKILKHLIIASISTLLIRFDFTLQQMFRNTLMNDIIKFCTTEFNVHHFAHIVRQNDDSEAMMRLKLLKFLIFDSSKLWYIFINFTHTCYHRWSTTHFERFWSQRIF